MAKLEQVPNFKSILDRPVKLTERPKPPPVGQYRFVLQGEYKEDVSAKKHTPFIEFTAKCLGPVNEASVDQEALNAYLTNPDGSKKKISDLTMKLQFYYETQLWRLQRFLKNLGFDPNTDASFYQVLAETPGCEFIGTVKHETSEDGEVTYARITDTAPTSA